MCARNVATAAGVLGILLTVFFSTVFGTVERVFGQEPSANQDLFSDQSTDTATTPSDTNDLFGDLNQPPAEGETEAPKGPTLQELWNEPKQLADSGQCAQAIEKFNDFIRILSRSQLPNPAAGYALQLAAQFEQGKCFAELKEYELAVKSLLEVGQQLSQSGAPIVVSEMGIDIQPFQVMLEVGKIRLEMKDFRSAKESFESAIELRPANAELAYYRGLALSKLAGTMGRTDAAVEHYGLAVSSLDRALKINRQYAEAYYERGLAKVAMGTFGMEDEFDEALEDLEKATQLAPEDLVLEYVGRKGIGYLQRASQTSSRDDLTAEDESEIVSDYNTAIEAFTRFIDEFPKDKIKGKKPKAEAGDLGGVQDAAGGEAAVEEEEEEEDKEALTLENVYVARSGARVALAEFTPVADREPLYRSAIADADAALDIDQKMPLALFNRGTAWRLLDDPNAAIDSFTKALKLFPGYPEAYLRRGIIWFHQGEPELALGDFTNAAIGVSDGRAKFWEGVAHAELGDYMEAILSYSEALRQNPGYKLAWGNRGLAYLRLGQNQRAVDDFDELIRRDRTNADAYYRRGIAYKRMDRSDLAEMSFRRAAELNPQYATNGSIR